MNFFTLIFKFDLGKGKTGLILAVSAAVFIFLPAVIVYAVDPYQIYRQHAFGFSQNQRYQMAGLINSYPYENLIFGTSMTENLKAHQVQQALGWEHVLRLSVSGGMPKEMTASLTEALRKHPVKNVLADIHWYYALYDADHEEEQHPFPSYLYGEKFERNVKYIFNRGTFEISLGLLKVIPSTEIFSSDLERLNSWMDETWFTRYAEDSNRQKLAGELRQTGHQFSLAEMKAKNYQFSSIDLDLEPVLKSHPQTEFHLFFPPYSIWHYATTDREKAEKTIMLRWYVVQRLSALKNVHIYGYDNICAITCSVRNYHDYGHYHQEIADFLVTTVGNSKYQLNPENIDTYLNSFIKLINSYSVDQVLNAKAYRPLTQKN